MHTKHVYIVSSWRGRRNILFACDLALACVPYLAVYFVELLDDAFILIVFRVKFCEAHILTLKAEKAI